MKIGRKITGGKYSPRRKKKKYEIRGQIKKVKIGNEKRKKVKIRGGNQKVFLLRGKTINVKTLEGKTEKIEIKNVLETPSNRFLARQNILTKGTIVKTDLGKVRITNRPTQEGMINGVLLE